MLNYLKKILVGIQDKKRKDLIMMKKFKLSKNKKILGVCGGLGEYFGIDPTIVRIIATIFLVMWPPMFVAYLIIAIISPNEE